MEGEGFEPSKAVPSDLQSDPFDRSGIPPRDTGRGLYTRRRVSQAPAAVRATIAAHGASTGERDGNIGECGAITAEDGAIAEKTREIAEKTRAIYPPTRAIYQSTRANAKERGAVIGDEWRKAWRKWRMLRVESLKRRGVLPKHRVASPLPCATLPESCAG